MRLRLSPPSLPLVPTRREPHNAIPWTVRGAADRTLLKTRQRLHDYELLTPAIPYPNLEPTTNEQCAALPTRPSPAPRCQPTAHSTPRAHRPRRVSISLFSRSVALAVIRSGAPPHVTLPIDWRPLAHPPAMCLSSHSPSCRRRAQKRPARVHRPRHRRPVALHRRAATCASTPRPTLAATSCCPPPAAPSRSG